MWSDDDGPFDGTHYQLAETLNVPQPLRRPHPPILIGGDGPRTLERVVEYGDEWLPIGWRAPEDLGRRIDELQTLAKEAGRAPIPVSVFGTAMRAETLEGLAAVGVHRIVFFMPPAEADVVLPRLQHAAKVAGL
jgi:alkanesulfonate monooxygenase SsuD/methylene tetrahydromethanopterin reductase-like flavin-dependent oxidoreductase (luciferase family)